MERLQKVLAHAGVASRRKAETLITDGRVSVNDVIVTELGTKVDTRDIVAVDGVPIMQEAPVYFLFYKPFRVLSAVADDKERKVVTDFFPSVPERIYPVGRLDFDTTGLLIMTNDGEFANHLMHPKYEIKKTYLARTQGIPNKNALKQLAAGVDIGDHITAPAEVEIDSFDRSDQTAMVRLTIHEGLNHQVKRMFEAVGTPVLKLKRETYGPLTLAGLKKGEWRPLNKFEVKQLNDLANTHK